MNTPIERFYPQLWDSEHALVNENPIVPPEQLEALPFYYEPYEDAMNVLKISEYQKVPPAILEPTQQIHPTPPGQQHSISEQGITCLTVMIQSSSLTPSTHPMSSEPFYIRLSCTRSKENLINLHTSGKTPPMKRSGALLALSYGHPLFNCTIVAATSLTRRYSIHHTSNSTPPVIDLRSY